MTSLHDITQWHNEERMNKKKNEFQSKKSWSGFSYWFVVLYIWWKKNSTIFVRSWLRSIRTNFSWIYLSIDTDKDISTATNVIFVAVPLSLLLRSMSTNERLKGEKNEEEKKNGKTSVWHFLCQSFSKWNWHTVVEFAVVCLYKFLSFNSQYSPYIDNTSCFFIHKTIFFSSSF